MAQPGDAVMLASQEIYWRNELDLARHQRAEAERRCDYSLKRLQTVRRLQHEQKAKTS